MKQNKKPKLKKTPQKNTHIHLAATQNNHTPTTSSLFFHLKRAQFQIANQTQKLWNSAKMDNKQGVSVCTLSNYL